MTATDRLVEFAVARLQEDLQRARAATPGYEVEVTAHMSSPAHAAFVRHFSPEWVVDDCVRKLAIIKGEAHEQAKLQEAGIDLRYHFNATRTIASAWREHPDYESAW